VVGRGRIQAVYGGFFDDLRGGDGEAACALLTEEEQRRTSVEAGATDCPSGLETFADFVEDYDPRLRDIEISGDSATATDPGDKSHGFAAQEVEFERVDGEWKISHTVSSD
jgi:hypothetical protein